MTSRILHVSGDFPDPIEPFKTPVIKSFLDLTAHRFDHKVISINRASPGPPKLISTLLRLRSGAGVVQKRREFELGTVLEYCAPGRGVFHRTMLERLGEELADIIQAQAVPVELLVGHKLTIEGIAVAKAAELTGLPYALTIQGNTDRRILNARPDLRALFRAIYLNASMVCTFTPIARDAIEKMLGKRPDGIQVIPCPTELDAIVTPRTTAGDVISVFHLKNYRVKNLRGLVQAAKELSGEDASRRIAIVGGGDGNELAHCKALAAGAKQIHFTGPVERNAMQGRMNDACVLVLPSSAESFGLVFVEALFAGLPIIYPKGTAIDGFFDDLPFAQAVDATSPDAIAKAISRAMREETEMKRALSTWQASGAAIAFTRNAIARKYEAALQSALEG